MPPFAAAVSAGVAAIMPAFTDLNGYSDDGKSALAARLAARPLRLRRRRHQRLQRHRRADAPRYCGGSGRRGGARAESGGGYRHDGRRVSARVAGCIEPRRGQCRGDRPVGAPRTDPEGAARIIRRSIPARQVPRTAGGADATAATCAAHRRALDGNAEKCGRCIANFARGEAPAAARAAGECLGRNARRVVGRGSAGGSGDRARGPARRIPAGGDSAFASGRDRQRGFQRNRRGRRQLRGCGRHHPLPGRSCGDERGSLQPGASGIARNSTAAGASRIRTGAALARLR